MLMNLGHLLARFSIPGTAWLFALAGTLCLTPGILHSQESLIPEGYIPIASNDQFDAQMANIEIRHVPRDYPLAQKALELAEIATLAKNANSNIILDGRMLKSMGIIGSMGEERKYVWGADPNNPAVGMDWKYINPSASYIEVLPPDFFNESVPNYLKRLQERPDFHVLGTPVDVAYIHLELIDGMNREYPWYMVLYQNSQQQYVFFPLLTGQTKTGQSFILKPDAMPEELRNRVEELNAQAADEYANSERQSDVRTRFADAQGGSSFGRIMLIGGGAALVLFAAIAFFRRK